MPLGELLTIRQTPPIDTGCGRHGFLQRSGEDACPRDMREWGFGTRVDDHIRLDTGFDGIAIAPGTDRLPRITHRLHGLNKQYFIPSLI